MIVLGDENGVSKSVILGAQIEISNKMQVDVLKSSQGGRAKKFPPR
jgi:hypothetical protein